MSDEYTISRDKWENMKTAVLGLYTLVFVLLSHESAQLEAGYWTVFWAALALVFFALAVFDSVYYELQKRNGDAQ